MLRSDVLQLIANGEGSGVEFKRDTVETHDLAKEIVAFANFQGGVVLLGVEDDGSISGITREHIEEWVMNICRDLIRPEVIPFYEVVANVDNGRDVAVVQIAPGWTVHHVWRGNRRTYFVRVGSTSREASPEELERLFQRRGGLRTELRPVGSATLDVLDMRRLDQYFRTIREQRPPAVGDTDGWQSLLVNTEFLDGEHDPPVATLAGVLLFGRNVNRFLPQAGIDAVAFPGSDRDYATIERESIRGPLTPLLAGADLVETGIVEQAVAFVNRNTRIEAGLANGARRQETRAYPDEAVREAIVNALVHRDYLLSGTTVELALFDGRLEVISPGRLPNGVTPDRMRVGVRAARNQLLKDVMRDYNYVEHLGMGVSRKIVRGMYEHNGTSPELVEDDERFTVGLFARVPG